MSNKKAPYGGGDGWKYSLEVDVFVGKNGLSMMGLLIPKSSGQSSFLFCMLFVVHIGHGTLHPLVAVLFSSKSVFGGGLKLRNRGTPKKKVMHLYRSHARAGCFFVGCLRVIRVPTTMLSPLTVGGAFFEPANGVAFPVELPRRGTTGEFNIETLFDLV